MTSFHQSSEWRQFRTTWRPRYQADINSGNSRCTKCGLPITTGQPWDIGHIQPGAATLLEMGWSFADLCDPSVTAAEHRKCNRRDGQLIAVARRKVNTAKTTGHFSW